MQTQRPLLVALVVLEDLLNLREACLGIVNGLQQKEYDTLERNATKL